MYTVYNSGRKYTEDVRHQHHGCPERPLHVSPIDRVVYVGVTSASARRPHLKHQNKYYTTTSLPPKKKVQENLTYKPRDTGHDKKRGQNGQTGDTKIKNKKEPGGKKGGGGK